MKVSFNWEDGGFASADITCDCGKVSKDASATDGDIWECENCHRTLLFTWKGMDWRELK